MPGSSEIRFVCAEIQEPLGVYLLRQILGLVRFQVDPAECDRCVHDVVALGR